MCKDEKRRKVEERGGKQEQAGTRKSKDFRFYPP
jgi:hypothetical protein